MKRLPILIAIIAAALLFGVTRVYADDTCSDLEQAFTVPDAFPLNGDDWLITEETNGTVSAVVEDGYAATGSNGGGAFNGVFFDLVLPVPATITHAEFTISDTIGFATGIMTVCYDLLCTETDTVISQINAGTPYDAESDPDLEYEDVLVIKLQVVGGGASTAIMSDLIIEGVLGACLYRPVRTDDTVADVTDGLFSTLATTAGARTFAIDDGTIVAIYHESTGYRVILVVNDVDPVQYSNLEVVFASIGDVVEGGCVLGYAGPPPPGELDGLGYIKYQHDADLTDWHDYGESLSNTPCNQNSNCLNVNPEFNDNNTGWLTRFAIADSLNSGEDSIIMLPPGGQIYQPGFQVDMGDTYYITLAIGVAGIQTHGSVNVWIGGTEATLPINVTDNEFITVTTLGLSPAWNGESELRIHNSDNNNSTLKITFACLHLGDAVIAPPACYFEDEDLTTDSFETEGGATFEDSIFGIGRYSIPAGGAIRSPVDISAFADADTDFTLRVTAAAPDGETDVTASIVDTGTEDEIQAIGNYAYASLLWADISRTFTVPDSTHLVGDLYIENTGDETVLISALCLSSDTGVWPGYENPDYANSNLLPITCTACTFPESLIDVVAWLNWLGCVLNYLIYCLLYTLVNNIWSTIIAVGTGLGLLGRWLSAAITVVAIWAWSAAGRLLAALIGSLIPIVNAILAWLFAQPFFQTILDAISIVGLWLDAVFDFIALIRNFIILAFNYGIAILLIVINTYTAFYVAISSPATYHIFPDCSDTGGALYDMCLGFDIMAFIFDQLPMALVFIGLLGALILMAQFGRVIDLIGDLAENL
jgi:hypothetical protein